MSNPQNITDYVQKWSEQGLSPLGTEEDESFEDLFRHTEFMSKEAFSGFIPAKNSMRHSPIFLDRMFQWIENIGITNQDKIVLFQLIGRLSYFSLDDFLCLYQTAFAEQICRWVWDQAGISMNDAEYQNSLRRERYERTWHASLTDSFLLSEFYHTNSLSAVESRPNFQTLREMGDIGALTRSITDNGFERLVLLEDFVGSGSQASRTLQWVLDNLDLPVLFCPMLMCPDGKRRLAQIAESSAGQLQIEPVVTLGDSAFLSTHESDDLLMRHVADLIERVHPQVLGVCPDDPQKPPYGPHGFYRRDDTHTGATVVMFSNSPNNSLPIIHFDSEQSIWCPVFPRVNRESP